jgi:Fe-S-cluster-containing dehydrogenase component
MPRIKVLAERCIGCFACEIACMQEHGLPPGPRLIRVEPADKEFPWSAGPMFRPVVCRHCGKATCMDACPEGALVRGEAGTVAVVAESCTGCRACLEACPWAVPQFHPESSIALLCDLCPAQTVAGARTACIHHCPADALELLGGS